MDRISRWAVSAWKLRTAWELWFFGGVLAVVWWQTVEDNIGGKPMIDALSAARSTLGTLTQNGFVQLALLVAAAGLFWRGVLRLSRVELQALERKAQLDADLLRPLIASFESHRIAMSSLVSDATKLPHLCAALVPLEAQRDRLTAKRQ